jgi:integrase
MQDFILGQGKSPTTALSAYRILAKALADALRDGRVTRNVAAVADAPKRAISKRGALTATQARQLLTSNSSDLSNAARLSIALLAGLRQGEKLGLTADMIDLKRGIITVAWQLQSLKANVQIPPHHEAIQITNSLWLTRPKSRAGWREVPMAPQLQQILAHYLERFPPNKHGLIFHNNGNPIPPAKDGRDWKQALSNANLEHVPLHSARHTTATLLHSLGVPDLVRISILGHSSSTVTAGYTHVTTEEAIEAMNKLGRLIES